MEMSLIVLRAKQLGVTVVKMEPIRGLRNGYRFTLEGERRVEMIKWLEWYRPPGVVFTYNVPKRTTMPAVLADMEYRDTSKFRFYTSNNPEGYIFGSPEAHASHHIQRLMGEYVGRRVTPDLRYALKSEISQVNEEIIRCWGKKGRDEDGGKQIQIEWDGFINGTYAE